MSGRSFKLLPALLVAFLTSGAVAQTSNFPADSAALSNLAKNEKRLVIYHGAPAEPMQRLFDEFHRTYPEIEVVNQRATGIRVYQNFYSEEQAGQHLADLVMISDYPTMVEAIKQKLITEWKMPTFDKIPEDSHIEGYAYAPYYNDIAISYNTTKVTPEEIALLKSDWRNIADPRFRGRVAVSPAICGNCYAGVHMFLDPKMKGYGEEFLKKVAANKPGIYGETAGSLDRVVAGEYDINFWLYETLIIPKYQSGAPIRWVHPSPTPVWANTFIGVSKSAPHGAAARLFMNWLFSDDGTKALQTLVGAQTTIKGYPDQRAVTKESWYDPVKEIYVVDRKRWEENYDSDMALWKKILEDGRSK